MNPTGRRDQSKTIKIRKRKVLTDHTRRNPIHVHLARAHGTGVPYQECMSTGINKGKSLLGNLVKNNNIYIPISMSE